MASGYCTIIMKTKLFNNLRKFLSIINNTTNRKVAGSIPAGVIGIFRWHKILPIALWPWGRLSP